MSISLSSIQIDPLYASYASPGFKFINNDREVTIDHQIVDIFNNEYSTSLSADYISKTVLNLPNFTENIKDFNFQDSYFTFLTEPSPLSAYLHTSKTMSGGTYGYDMKTYNAMYDWRTNNFTQSATAHSMGQYAGIVDANHNLNLFPLKNKIDLNDNQYSITSNYRDYQKIYDVNDSLFLQFKINKYPHEVRPDEYTNIFNAYSISARPVSALDFINNGAIGGNCPLNSDIIFFEQNEYGSYTNNGTENINTINNGTMLCLWLSSQTVDPSSNKVWMERWYDPSTVTQGTAFISSKNDPLSTSFRYINDIVSTKIVSEKEKLVYLRYGPNRNQSYVDSLSANLQVHFEKWDAKFSSEINSISGFVIGDYNLSTDTFKLDGTRHGHIPPEDGIFVDNDFTVSLWANSDDWKYNNDSQFFGNYHNESGYGLFYNTGTSNNLISIPTSGDNLFALNDRGFKVFEKDLKSDLGLTNISINYIKTDLFGNRWLYDSFNHNIYKLENDDIVIKTIHLPSTSVITRIECNSHNEIFIFNNYSHQISSFDSAGTYISTQTLSSYHDNFEIDIHDNIIYDSAQFLTVNSQNKIIKMRGPTLFIDDVRVLFLTDKPQCLRLDLEDNIWILFKDRIIKTDSNGLILFDTKLELAFSDTDAEMCFVKTYNNTKEQINLWIIFNKSKQVIIVNSMGRIIKRLDLTKLFVGQYCGTFQLNIVGDFSGFDNRRKFEKLNGYVISPSNPSVCVRLGVRCGNTRKIIQLHSSVEYLDGWTHLSFTLSRFKNSTTIKLYVNGYIEEQVTIQGNYHIEYGYKSSPFIIGGNSGKLGARNLEKSIIRTGFFIGEIDDIRIYNKTLNDYEVLNLALKNHYEKWGPISMYTEIPEITLIEEIDSLHINRYKGFKSNIFNIRIKNLSQNTDLQGLVSDYISNNIQDFVPANAILNQILFE